MMYWIYGWNTHGVFMGQQPPMRTLARARLLRIMRLVRILQFVNELRTMVRWWKMGNMPELAAVHNFHTYHMELRLTGPFCLWVDDGTTPNGSFLPVSWWLVNPHPVGHVGGQFHALLGMDHPLDAAHQVHHRRGSEKATFWTRFGHVGSGAKSQKEHRWIGRKLDSTQEVFWFMGSFNMYLSGVKNRPSTSSSAQLAPAAPAEVYLCQLVADTGAPKTMIITWP